jgi:hypothetical protein
MSEQNEKTAINNKKDEQGQG